MKRNRGFTLIELLVVIIIVGILAAVSVPIMKGYRTRAILTEAVAALGMIRTLQRAYYVQWNDYCDVGTVGIGGGLQESFPGIKIRKDGEAYGMGDLDGTYFSQECYYIVRITPQMDKFFAWCFAYREPVDWNVAPKAEDARDIVRDGAPYGCIKITTEGELITNNIPNSGFKNYDEEE